MFSGMNNSPVKLGPLNHAVRNSEAEKGGLASEEGGNLEGRLY